MRKKIHAGILKYLYKTYVIHWYFNPIQTWAKSRQQIVAGKPAFGNDVKIPKCCWFKLINLVNVKNSLGSIPILVRGAEQAVKFPISLFFYLGFPPPPPPPSAMFPSSHIFYVIPHYITSIPTRTHTEPIIFLLIFSPHSHPFYTKHAGPKRLVGVKL